MLTGAVANQNLTLYSTDSIVGVNTNYIFVFNNNAFTSVIGVTNFSNSINLSLANSVSVNGNVKVAVYPGGITTTNSNLSTTFTVLNNTLFYDNTAPSLFEMIQQQSYNYTSYVYSNYITGITTEANFPSANIVLKRNPPKGAITLNEGLLGSMRVHRFAAISSSVFTIPPYLGNFSTGFKYFAFDYNSYGNQNLSGINLSIKLNSALASGSYAYLSINEDYYGSPSPISLGVSTSLDLGIASTLSFTNFVFGFQTSLLLNTGKYWIVFTPTVNSTIPDNQEFTLNQSALENYYSGSFYNSSDGVVFSSTIYNGVAYTVFTNSGIVLPSNDTIYNQLNQPQNLSVQYGDSSDLNVYTSLAVPTSSHSISKNFVDGQNVYAIETLIDSSGQNQFEVIGTLNGVSTSYYSMIANSLTINTERFDLYNPIALDSLELVSLGDYYTQSPQGTVLVSASDFLGIAEIDISTSPNFPASGTTSIVLNPPQQQYINNFSYNFGDLGKKFSDLQQGFSGPIQYVYKVNNAGNLNYVVITENSLIVSDGTNILFNYSLGNSLITSSISGASGIIFADTLGNIYSYATFAVTLLGTVSNVPMSFTSQLISTYIGVGTQYDTTKPSNRKRIYLLNNGVISHQSWSTSIPEPEITMLYSTSQGLYIGSYDQNNLIGKIYLYVNSTLTLIYTGFLRPDFALYSSNSGNLYIGFGGSQILYYKLGSNNLQDTGVSIVGDVIQEINTTRVTGKIFVITDQNSYIFDESTFVSQLITSPAYNATDQAGLLIKVENLNLGLTNYDSTSAYEIFSALNYDPILNGFSSLFQLQASGFIVFSGISTLGYQTNFYLQIPNNSTLQSFTFNGQSISTTSFSATLYPNVPQSFNAVISGSNIIGVGTIVLYNGVNTSAPIVGISSLTPPKNINWYLPSGSQYDLFGCSDGTIRQSNMVDLASNQYNVYARFTDIVGNVSSGSNVASDYIYNQVQQQINGQSLPTGRIVQIDTNNNVTSFTPSEGTNNFIYSGVKIVRETGAFESEPFYASDVTSWNSIQVLALIPGFNEINPPANTEYGTSVTLYVKTASNYTNLVSGSYTNSYSLSTIDSADLGNSVVSILANISSLSGAWIQFKLVLETASANISPNVYSVLLTYNGAGTSVFVTKTFDASVQSNIVPTPKFVRGILTANYVNNGGSIDFYYTTDPTQTNPVNFNLITPNQIFTLPSPASTIKFGVVLKTATNNPCFVDSFAAQMDLGDNNLYFMPPIASFSPTPYYNASGVRVANAYQFNNTSLGIASAYVWSFGTSIYTAITTSPTTAQNPIIQFMGTSTQTVSLTVVGWSETINNNTVVFQSDPYSYSFIST